MPYAYFLGDGLPKVALRGRYNLDGHCAAGAVQAGKAWRNAAIKSDGGGLNVQDGKYWRLSYRFAGKQQTFALVFIRLFP